MLKKGVIFILSLGLCALVSGDWSFYGGPWCAKNLADVAVGMVSGSPVLYGVNKDYSLVKSTDEGQSWTVLLEDVNIRCVTCDPNNGNLVYIGRLSSDGGMRYSTNGGTNWTQINSGLPASFTPSAIAMRDAQHIVLGLEPHNYDEISIYYWDVNQWTAATFPTSEYTGFRITNLKWDPRSTNEEVIYASSDKVASGGNPNYIGVYRSEDYGHSWSQIGQSDPEQPGYMMRPEALSVCCALNGYIFAGYRPEGDNHNGGLMRTTDGGTNWTRVLHQEWLPVTDVLGDPINPDKVYAAFGSGDYSYDGLGVYENMSSGEIALWHPFNQGLTDLYTNVLITFEVNFQHFLYLGTDNSFYVRNLNVFPNYWIERVKNIHKPKVIAVEPRIPNFFSFSDKANYASSDDGDHWSTISTEARSTANEIAEVHPSSDNEMIKWMGVNLPDPEEHLELWLRHSSNGGSDWETAYSTTSSGVINFDYCYYSPYRVYTSEPYYSLRSDNQGSSWNQYELPFGLRATSVDCDPNDPDHIFVVGQSGCYESTDGGGQWVMKNTGLPLFVDAKILFKPFSSCSLLLQITGPVVVGPPEFYRSAHNGDDWSYLSTISDHYPGPFAIDPEEPSLVYTALFNYNTYYYDFYFSVDYCRVWIQGNNELPNTHIWDLEVDPNAPEYLYAGTDSGVYYYDPGFKNKHLTSSSGTATAYNASRHLLRVHGTNEFWITYESGGAIYVVHSTDEGQTWSRKVEIGEGYNPAISIRDVPEYPPCIVWRTITGQDTIYFARYISEEKWTAPTAIVISQTGVDFGPPSFVIGNNNYGHVVYSDGTNAYYTQFYIYNPEPGIPEEIGSGENPSIGFMNPGGSHPEIHIVWEDNNKIRYRSRTMSGIWGNQETVSTNNSNHPSVEVSGTNVYVIWERFGDIEYCYAVYTNGSHYWSKIGDFESDYKLDYPVFTGGNAMSCVVDVDGNYEIYFWYNAGAGWVGPINISNSTQYSHYPHIVHKQTLLGTIIYFTWTEKDNAPFDIMFENYTFGGPNPDEDLAFYIAEGGEQDASPFNLRREGYLQYGPEPYKRIDYDAEYLEYQFANLNPRRLYGLGAYLYQHGHPNLPISAKVDNYQTGAISLPPDTLIILRHMLPTMLYEDSTINVKIFGNNAVSAALVIYEYENDSIGGGGPQSLGDLPLNFDSPIMSVFPNPVQKEINIQYTLFRETKVNLSIFDVAGRSVRNVISKNQISGTYHKSLSIANLPQGVYFIKLDTGDDAIVQKVIFIK